MKLSTKSEYACLALIVLSRKYGSGYISTERISEEFNIPKKYLEQILLVLKGAGYIRSKRGSEGGYRISKSPAEITIAEVIRLMDGPLAAIKSVSVYFHEETPLNQHKPLLDIFKEIRDYVSNKLETTTFADII
ncbi:MAG: Rrf2 family transcriptional regulator [Deltaproteobacteria bacterium]|nr:Rrf2 family transcriptional regulator [Candidatus Zymogenaceae bacterium]